MTCYRAVAFLLATASVCGFSSALGAEDGGRIGRVDLQLEANKARYICGEPIILRATVRNPSDATFKSRYRTFGLRPHDKYGIEIAPGKERQFKSIWDHEKMRDINVTTPPIDDDFWSDRHWIPGTIAPGAHYERTDMLVLPKPGQYRLRTRIIEGKDTRFDSPPVSVEVVPLSETQDSIAGLGDQVFAVRLGRALVTAHYTQEIWGGTGAGGSLNQKAFDSVAPTIIEKHRGSAFRETVMYADIMDGLGADHLERPAALERSKALGRQFIKDYPQSLLLPDVYYTLFRCHVQQKEPEKAAAVRAEALPKFPNATVLRTVREFDLDKIRQPQQGAEAPPSRGKGVTVVKPRTEDKSEEGDAPAKKDSPEKGD